MRGGVRGVSTRVPPPDWLPRRADPRPWIAPPAASYGAGGRRVEPGNPLGAAARRAVHASIAASAARLSLSRDIVRTARTAPSALYVSLNSRDARLPSSSVESQRSACPT